MSRTMRILIAACPAMLLASPLTAGMPSLLPEDLPTILRLNEEPHERLQAISFFLMGIVCAAAGVKLTWNLLSCDFPALPRLSFGKAMSLVVLCGLLFVVVLTMISGARELMTPGAWRKQGLTYTLKDLESAPEKGDPDNPAQEERAAR